MSLRQEAIIVATNINQYAGCANYVNFNGGTHTMTSFQFPYFTRRCTYWTVVVVAVRIFDHVPLSFNDVKSVTMMLSAKKSEITDYQFPEWKEKQRHKKLKMAGTDWCHVHRRIDKYDIKFEKVRHSSAHIVARNTDDTKA